MYKFGFVLLAVIGLAVARPDGKIVGGRDTDIREVPHQLSVQYRPSELYIPQHICGASIIAPNFALSAAHCLINNSPNSFVLRSGSSIRGEGGVEHDVIKIIPHPDWNNVTMNCDFVIFKVAKPFGNSATERQIEMATAEAPEGTLALVSGWGHTKENGTSPKQLQSVQLPVKARDDCKKLYGQKINANMICAGDVNGGHDSCQGDSGGPLVATVGGKTSLIGVVSFGAGCARPRILGVYSNVVAQRNWIIKNMV